MTTLEDLKCQLGILSQLAGISFKPDKRTPAQMTADYDAFHADMKRKWSKKKVYFARSDHGTVKIGVSGDPEDRVKELQTADPSLTLIGVVSGGVRREKQLHKVLSKYRIAGELFYFSNRVEQVLTSLTLLE